MKKLSWLRVEIVRSKLEKGFLWPEMDIVSFHLRWTKFFFCPGTEIVICKKDTLVFPAGSGDGAMKDENKKNGTRLYPGECRRETETLIRNL